MTIDRLRCAGWSGGETAYGPPDARVWQVTGTNGENAVAAYRFSQAEAWRGVRAGPCGGDARAAPAAGALRPCRPDADRSAPPPAYCGRR
jgi:hypothetical protein